MKRIGRFILFVFSIGILVVAYWLTPHLMHSQTQLVNFAELIAGGGATSLALTLLVASVVMGKTFKPAQSPRVPPGVRPRTVPEALAGEFKVIRKELSYAKGNTSHDGEELPPDSRLKSLCYAVEKLAAITELNSSK